MPKFLSQEAQDMLHCLLISDPSKRLTLDSVKKHQWYSIVPPRENQGIVVGFNKIGYDLNVIKQLETYGLNQDYAKKCIEGNKHNHVTATYYLLLQKRSRSGGTNSDTLKRDGSSHTKRNSEQIELKRGYNKITTNPVGKEKSISSNDHTGILALP